MFDLDGIAGEDRSGWSAAARSERLLELLELRERVEAEGLRCLGEWEADLAWAGGRLPHPALRPGPPRPGHAHRRSRPRADGPPRAEQHQHEEVARRRRHLVCAR